MSDTAKRISNIHVSKLAGLELQDSKKLTWPYSGKLR